MVWCFAKHTLHNDFNLIIMNAENKEFRVGLCAGRHDIIDGDIEIKDFIFPNPIENPNDFEALRFQANDKLEDIWFAGGKIFLYVTGLSQALTTVLSEAMHLFALTEYDMEFTVMHYDRETGTYKGHNFFGGEEPI